MISQIEKLHATIMEGMTRRFNETEHKHLSENVEHQLEEAYDLGYEAGECIDADAKLQQFHDRLSSILTEYENIPNDDAAKGERLYEMVVELQSETSKLIN